jgi:uncharacterized protein YpiB (UPF0302 family)
MDKLDSNYAFLLSVYADMIIDESLRSFKVERLYEEIDSALSIGDEAKFIQLTEQLNAISEQSSSPQ